MQLINAVSLMAGLAAAATLPVSLRELESLANLESNERSIFSRQSLTRTELETGGTCPPVIFIYARGSTQSGNLGDQGVIEAAALEAYYGDANVWVQGVGDPYTASLLGNLAPKGAPQDAIDEMKRLLTLANTNCPDAKVVAGGYSQGAALAAAAIGESSDTIRDQVVGATLFGYTKNEQNNESIPNYPLDRTAIYCEDGDLVCEGTLLITGAHSSYDDEAAEEAPQFLISKIDA